MNQLVAAICVGSMFVNLILVAFTLKMYTEFAKERFRGRD